MPLWLRRQGQVSTLTCAGENENANDPGTSNDKIRTVGRRFDQLMILENALTYSINIIP